MQYKRNPLLKVAICFLPLFTFILLFAHVSNAGNIQFRKISIEPHQYTGGWKHFVGGGLAGFDCNNDNFMDIFVAGGKSRSQLFINKTGKRRAPIIFQLSTDKVLQISSVIGAYPIDIDNDTIIDLVVLRDGQNSILRGLGNCKFEQLSKEFGFVSSDSWTTSFSAIWENNNALPTLAFGNYVDATNPNGPFGTCDSNRLYRPENNRYKTHHLLKPGYCALSMLFSDWGRKGRADLRISNDRHYYVHDGEEQLWAMEQSPRLYTEEDGWQKFQIWGMGIASRDIDYDGFPEIYLTSMADQKLHSLQSTIFPKYQDAQFNRGITAHRPFIGGDGRPSTGWHVEFGDVNNDGLDDIFITKGNVDQMPASAMKDPNNMLINNGDIFTEFAHKAGLASMAKSRGALMVDFNLDGRLDIAVNNRNSDMEIYQNITSVGNWLAIKLNQPLINRYAIGAWIELETNGRIQYREITIGGGHASGDLAPEHFGLGDSVEATVAVVWPDGVKSERQKIHANQLVIVNRQNTKLTISVIE